MLLPIRGSEVRRQNLERNLSQRHWARNARQTLHREKIVNRECTQQELSELEKEAREWEPDLDELLQLEEAAKQLEQEWENEAEVAAYEAELDEQLCGLLLASG